ncbi:cytochrome P450 [Streptomyces chromofuscus]|uniref:cytochrome P450 n=1 Tax=Streptomyces chromofuscus TaxID=42881 RepID=UPI00167A8D63|nr:cytochrome P450 [Streptomyces chromofuscus]GGT43290.1 cytochrome P450 [Streptomyces chromofuscus]
MSPALTWVGEPGYWLVDDPDLSRQVLTTDSFSSSTLTPSFDRFVSERVKEECAFLLDVLSRWFVDQDPPEHTAERRLCQPHFSRGLLDQLAPDIRRIVVEVMDSLPDHPDAVTDISRPISARVIGLALGMGDVDAAVLHRWSDDIARFVGAVYRADYAAAAQRSVMEMADFVERHLTVRGDAGPIGPYRGSDRRQNIAAHTMMLFGGLETSARLLSQLIWAVTTRERTNRAGIDDVDDIIDRVIRRFPPIKFVTRISAADVDLHGTTVRKGDLVLVSLTSATDGPAPALAFGAGRHFCLGMTLTLLEARIVLEEFLARYPEALVDTDGVGPSDNSLYHGFERLPLRL